MHLLNKVSRPDMPRSCSCKSTRLAQLRVFTPLAFLQLHGGILHARVKSSRYLVDRPHSPLAVPGQEVVSQVLLVP